MEQKGPGRPKKSDEEKAKPTDKLTCNICGKKYTRAHRTSHNKSKVHQLYAKINEDVRRVVLDEPKKKITVKEFKYDNAVNRLRKEISTPRANKEHPCSVNNNIT